LNSEIRCSGTITLEQTIKSLADMPERGNYPQELERIGVCEYREAYYKPYRIIYAIQGKDVIVHCVLDELRDMRTLLLQRLLRVCHEITVTIWRSDLGRVWSI
jgi:toxin ParE1/3/4